MRLLVLAFLALPSQLLAGETPDNVLQDYCAAVRIRAENLLTARFQPGFDLMAAKQDAESFGEPLLVEMVRSAWLTQRGPYDQQPRQIQNFADYWYGRCILDE